MKRPAIIYSKELLIFFILVAVSLLLLVPLSRQLDRTLAGIRVALFENVEEETGLRFSYKSLSPSVFRSIKISGLVVSDASNGSVIAEVSSVSISCSVISLLKGDYAGAIRNVNIENGSIKFDYVRNYNALRLLKKMVAERKAVGADGAGKKRDRESFFSDKPFTVRIRNVDMGYSDTEQDIAAHISRGSAVMGKEGIDFDLESRIRYDRPSIAKPGSLATGIYLKGTINRDLDSGSASLVLQSLESGLFSVSRMGLVTSYRSGILNISSVQDIQPVDVSLVWKIPEKDLTVDLECENLLPLRWIQVRSESGELAKLRNMSMTGSARFRLSEKDGMEYSMDMKSSVPESFYSGGDVSCKLEGTADSVIVKELAVNGSAYDIGFTGSFDIRNRIPEGVLSVRKMSLPSGASLSGDVFFQPAQNGFVCIAPTCTVNGTVFSSVTLSTAFRSGSLEFAFSALDSSGTVTADGTVTSNGKDRFLQLYAAFDSISVADVVGAASGFLSKGNPAGMRRVADGLKSYALTTEIYVTSDISSFSFNCPRLVLASSRKNGMVFLLSAKGNEAGIDISDIDFTYGMYAISGDVSAGFEKGAGAIFNADLVVNEIPYSMNGMYANGSLSVYGDYGLAGSAVKDDFGGVTGSFKVSGFPVPVGPRLLSCSLDTRFAASPKTKWKLAIDNGTVEDVRKDLPLSTVAQFQGSIDAGGIYLENLALSDAYSTVSGYAGIGILDEEGGNRQYTAELSLASADSKESFRLSGSLRDQVPERFIEADVQAQNCPLMRFLPDQQKDNLASFSLSLSGTPSNLMVSSDVTSLLYRLSGFNLDARGKLLLEDRELSLYDSAASWNGQVFTDIKGSCSLDDARAKLESKYSGVLGRSPITAGVSVDISSDPKNAQSLKMLAERFTVHTSFSDLRWKTLIPSEPVECTFVREPGITAIYAGKSDAVTGFLLDDGTFSLLAGGTSPVWFIADGSIVNSEISINVNDFHASMAKLWPLTGLGIVQYESGSVDGDFTITGLINDPEFNGTLMANTVIVRAPGFLQDVYGPVSFPITAEGKTFTAPRIIISGKEGAVSANAVAEFDRWIPSSVHILANTLPDQPLRVDTENQYFKAKGYGSCDLDMTFTRRENIVNGDISFERGACAIVFSGFMNQEAPTYTYHSRDSLVNLNLHVGKKVEFRWPTDNFPILRGLIQAEKPLEIKLDTARQSFQFKGEAILRGGEIYYIKRSFYLRNGSIVFNENQDIFDPVITVRAEIRERDEEGEPVRIILSVDKQPLNSFVPVLTSDPVKSDAELMVLLGQAASGDTSRETLLQNTVISASDIFTRMSLFRNTENQIRDVLHLDIFSVRTLLLQNAIIGSAMQKPTDKKMSVGNYFDNTTVYMGKYLGSAIYADALLHFSYYDPKTEQKTVNDQAVYGNMLFQPELGMEMATPFFLLRWGITPESPETLFVTDNSITLSWKFSY